MKVSGQWYFHYGYYSSNLTENKDTGTHSDRTRARQRVRTQIQFIADENLSALLNMEANLNWGKKSDAVNGAGGAIDADQTTFVIKRAHLDWTIPNTQTKVRMGMQGIAMPSVTFGNPVMNADVAGISVSNQFTPEIGLTVFWARPYDQEWGDSKQTGGDNLMDEMDMFGVMLPIKTDVVRITPWAMFALIGKDSGFYTNSTYNYRGPNTIQNKGKFDSATYGWWGGMSFELPVIDPFFVKIDAMMGGLETGSSDDDTFGWLVAGDIGYKFSFGSLSAFGWYASGNEDKDDKGFLPIISDDGGFAPTRYGTAGSTNRSVDRMITGTGVGMWGMGLKMADLSFIDNLKHTVSFTYMGGTNKGDAFERRSVRDKQANVDRFGYEFLMSSDRAYEIDLLSKYKASENLSFTVDFAYVWLDLGDHWIDKKDTTGSFATMIGVEYAF